MVVKGNWGYGDCSQFSSEEFRVYTSVKVEFVVSINFLKCACLFIVSIYYMHHTFM